MRDEEIFRVAFLSLFGALAVVRVYYSRKVQQAGERLSPSREAIAREGKTSVVLRFLIFVAMLGGLLVTIFYPAWLAPFNLPLPVGIRWTGVGLGLLSLALLIWVHPTLGKQWSTHLQLRGQHQLGTTGRTASDVHRLFYLFPGYFPGVGQWVGCAFLHRGGRYYLCPDRQRRNDAA